MENFTALKEKGLAKILKTSNSCAISYAQFDPNTGERLADVVRTIDIESLKTERATLQARLEEINSFIQMIKDAPRQQ